MDLSVEDAEGNEPTVSPASTARSTDEMIRFNTVVGWFEPLFCGRFNAKLELIDLIRDGRLTCYTRRYWPIPVTDTDHILQHKSWRTPPPDAQQRHLLPRSLWLHLSPSDSRQWDWKRGRCFIVEQKRGGVVVAHFLKGLWLLRSQVIDLRSDLIGDSRSPERGGRQRKVDVWTQFWLEIVELEKSGRLRAPEMARGSTLIQTVEKALGKQGLKLGLSDAALKPAIQNIRDRFHRQAEPDEGWGDDGSASTSDDAAGG